MAKFGRNYEIQILTPQGNLLTIQPPFSVRMRVTRNTLASTNSADFTIYNLKETTRRQIYKDRFEFAQYWQIVVRAGYQDKMDLIFQGNIYEAFSSKEGPDWVTKMQCQDGLFGVQNGFTSQTANAGTKSLNVLESVVSDLPNVVFGAIGELGNGTADRGQVLFGKTADVLEELTEGQYFIDNERINFLTDDEYLSTEGVILLDSDQLLATPIRRESQIDVRVLFQSNAFVGQLAEIQSLESIYNGQYKVVGFTHDFEYLGSDSGKAETALTLFAGAGLLRGVS